jgi:hypothetical protein
MSVTNPTDSNRVANQTGDSSGTPTKLKRIKQGVGDGINTITSAASNAVTNVTEWTPVKTVRNSAPWYYITLPFSAVGSFFGAIWARVSRAVWGSPSVVTAEVTLESKGFFWNSTYTMPTEAALRDGYMTVEQGVQDKKFTMEDAQLKGWVFVTVPGRLWGTNTMMLKTAVEGGYMTVKEAIDGGHITEAQALKADWIKKT